MTETLVTYILDEHLTVFRETNQFGPLASVGAAKDLAAVQAMDEELEWAEVKMEGASEPHWVSSAQGARYVIRRAELILGDAEIDAAVLRAAAGILKRRFGVITTEREMKALRAAAWEIEHPAGAGDPA